MLILGIIVGIGELITKDGNGNVLGDRTIPHWLAAHRTPGLTRWSLVFSTLGATQAILIVALATCVVFLAVTRRWRPVVFVAAVMFGELAAFLAAAAVVKRPRPDVTHLDQHLPTSAYPSGHEAATCCLYVAIAILVIGHARGWWRWLFLIPAIAMPVLVALSRMYRGEHHPTDILGSLLFAALWLTADDPADQTGASRRAHVVASLTERADGFVPIESYGVIGDGKSVALIARDGAVDWWTAPAMDSVPVFAAMLDPADGGCFTLEPAVPYQASRRYLPGTNVLETTFTTEAGTVRVIDSMNQGPGGPLPWTELARDIHPVSGRVPMRWQVIAGTMFNQGRPWSRFREVPLLHAGGLLIGLLAEDAGRPSQDSARSAAN